MWGADGLGFIAWRGESTSLWMEAQRLARGCLQPSAEQKQRGPDSQGCYQRLDAPGPGSSPPGTRAQPWFLGSWLRENGSSQNVGLVSQAAVSVVADSPCPRGSACVREFWRPALTSEVTV